jgi:heme/copper-type cytochrome/quinol oxidase subunit 3
VEATLATAIEVQPQTAHGAGHDAHGGHGHPDHPPTSTGLNSRKMLMWLFLTSDCMFFGALIATYMSYRNRSIELGTPPYPNEIFDIPYTSVSAFVLLMSSLTMVLALSAIQRGDNRGLRIWIGSTALLGGIFVGGQFFEFTTFAHEGLTLQSNIFGSSFYVLTGFHGAHVTIGIVWLLSILFLSLRGGLPAERAADVEIAGLYWHFVDIVWIVIFTLVYLIPYADGPEAAVEAAPEAFLRVLTLGERVLAALPF